MGKRYTTKSKQREWMTIPKQHLRACPKHRVVAERGDDCPCCITGIESRPDAYDNPISQLDLRWQVEPETMVELIPLMEEYLEDKNQGPMWVTVAELPKSELAAGYTKQERWFNILQYRWGSFVKTICRESEASETIETLRKNGYDKETLNGGNNDTPI